MANKTVRVYDQGSQSEVDILLSDNGDGTYSLSTTASFSGSVQATPTGSPGAANANVVSVQGIASMTPLRVDGSAVTANAGTNLNTSALALETGGNLASVATNTGRIPAQGQAAMAASLPVAIASNQSALPVSGAVTANAGTNLNTSALALDATLTGGTQATQIADGTTHSQRLAVDSTGKIGVNALPALPAGTNTIGSVKLTDGTSVPYVNPNGVTHPALATVLYDGAGNVISTIGGGTQYTDAGSAVPHPIGTALIYTDAGNIPRAVSTAQGLPVQSLSAADATASGTIAALSGTVDTGTGAGYGDSTVWLSLANGAGANAWSAATTVSFEATLDGTTWFPFPMERGDQIGSTPVTSITGPGPYLFKAGTGGLLKVHAKVTALGTNEQVAVAMRVSYGPGNPGGAALPVWLASLLAGEDLTYGCLVTQPRTQYKHLAASGQVKASSGYLAGIFVASASATPTITVYDNTAGSGTVLINTFTPVAGTKYDCNFATAGTGLYVTIAGTVDCTVFYQ